MVFFSFVVSFKSPKGVPLGTPFFDVSGIASIELEGVTSEKVFPWEPLSSPKGVPLGTPFFDVSENPSIE